MSSLFNRVWAKVEGSKEEVNPHDWRLPSSYSTSSRKDARTPTLIPHPSVFRNALISYFQPGGDGCTTAPDGRPIYPDISHAAVHLALLECFRNLRLSVAELGIIIKSHSCPAPRYRVDREEVAQSATAASDVQTQAEAETEQWNLLIRLAITRFQTWWSHLDQVFNHATAYTHHGGAQAVVQLTKDYLPPLDVLLVWYAFILQPGEYQSACFDCEIPHLTSLCFPWPAIRDSIDLDSMTLTLTRPAANLFKTLTGQSADILQYIQAPPAYAEPSMLRPMNEFFALVKKQDPFLDLSHKLLWIRSPALVGSLQRSCDAYFNAQSTNELFFMDPDAIPFGIDLVWRTHRLYPAHYAAFRHGVSDIAPPDDWQPPVPRLDKGPPPSLPRAQPPGVTCLCWTCERLRDDLPTFSLPPREEEVNSPSFPPLSISMSSSSTSSSVAAAEFATDSRSSDPKQLSDLSTEQLHCIKDDLGFYHAVETARRQGLPLPKRPPTFKEKKKQEGADGRRKQMREWK